MKNSETTNKKQTWRVARTCGHLINQKLRTEILEAVSGVLFGDCWESWDQLTRLEEEFGRELGYPYVAAVQSGSAALLLSLEAVGIKAGDEVITVANSDMATTGCISHLGAVPVLCDVLAADYTMDPDRVEELISPRTKALLPVSLYGHPANVKRLREIAAKYHLAIIEDAALATTARDYGEPIGRFADMAIFSTIATKQLGSAGLGGLVVTEHSDLWEKVQVLKGYGMPVTSGKKVHGLNDHIAEGWHLRMVPIDAAVLRVKLPHLAEWTEKRKMIAQWYEAYLAGIGEVTLPVFRPESEPVRREFAVQVPAKKRMQVFHTLQSKGVQTALNYCPPAHQRPVYRSRNLRGSDQLPVTERLGQEIITLPVDPMLDEIDIALVCNTLKEGLIASG